jgi:hypothetical protein
VRQVVLGVGAAVLLASGLFGGLERAAPDARTTLVAHRTHVAEPFAITISQVAWSDDLGETFGPSKIGRYLLVRTTLRTDQDTTVSGFVVGEALRLHGLSGFAAGELDGDVVDSEDAEPRVVVTADRVPLGEVGPGLTYDVVFVWEQRAAEPLPETVQVESYAHGFRRSSLDSQEDWFDRSPDAIGTFVLERFGAA